MMFCDRDIEDDLGECDCCPGEVCTQRDAEDEAGAEPLLRQHLATTVEALEQRERHLVNACRNAGLVDDERLPVYEQRLTSTQAALAWMQRLAETAASFRVNDYGGSGTVFPQFDVGLLDNFAHGGHEGVRMGEQWAQIQTLETVETDALLRLAADLECRRRNGAAS